MEDEELFASDENGKEASIGIYNFPTIFPLGEIHAPIVSHEVQFEASEQKKEEEKKQKNKNDKWGKWDGAWGGIISSAISKTLGYLKRKYTLNCRGDHKKSKNSFFRMGFLFFDFWNMVAGARIRMVASEASYEKCYG